MGKIFEKTLSKKINGKWVHEKMCKKKKKDVSPVVREIQIQATMIYSSHSLESPKFKR